MLKTAKDESIFLVSRPQHRIKAFSLSAFKIQG